MLGRLATRKGSGSTREYFGPTVLAVAAILWLLVAEPLRILSLQGQIAAVMAMLIAASLPVAFIRRPGLARVTGYTSLLVFLGWAGCVSVWIGFDRNGVQNMSIYIIFVGTLILSAEGSIHTNYEKILVLGRRAALLGSIPFLVLELLKGSDIGRLIGTGAIPGVASIGLVICLTSKRSFGMRILILIFSVTIFMSLSRAYIVFALICLSVPSLQTSTLRKFFLHFAARLLTSTLIGVLVMTQFPPLRDRFLINDGKSIAGLDIGTSGRDNLWASLWDSILHGNFILGNGAGSAERVIEESFYSIKQPHNDYLRILNDFGLIGLTLWCLGLLVVVCIMARRFCVSYGSDVSALHLSGFISLLLVILSSFLDNVVIYVFLMAPIGLLVGLSIGRPLKSPVSRALRG